MPGGGADPESSARRARANGRSTGARWCTP